MLIYCFWKNKLFAIFRWFFFSFVSKKKIFLLLFRYEIGTKWTSLDKRVWVCCGNETVKILQQLNTQHEHLAAQKWTQRHKISMWIGVNITVRAEIQKTKEMKLFRTCMCNIFSQSNWFENYIFGLLLILFLVILQWNLWLKTSQGERKSFKKHWEQIFFYIQLK